MAGKGGWLKLYDSLLRDPKVRNRLNHTDICVVFAEDLKQANIRVCSWAEGPT